MNLDEKALNKDDKSKGISILHSFDRYWPNIQPMVKNLIYNQPISKSDWQNIFYDVHKICYWENSGCHKILKALEQEFLESSISQLKYRISIIDDGQSQLKEYLKCWTDFKLHCQRFPVAFQQLDLATKTATITASSTVNGQTTLLNIPTRISGNSEYERSTVRSHMLRLWVQHILNPNYNRLMKSAFDLILLERKGLIVDQQLILGFCDSCLYIRFHTGYLYRSYIENFENNYYNEIDIFYTAKAVDYLNKSDAIEYIKWALKTIEKEETKARLYLGSDEKCLEKIRVSCNKVLVVNFIDQVLNEASKYICSNDYTNTKLIFQFIDKIEGSSENLLVILGNHIITTGLGHLMNSPTIVTNCEKFVEIILETYKQFSEFINLSFGDDKRAEYVLEKALAEVLNNPNVFYQERSKPETPSKQANEFYGKNCNVEVKSPELIATYCDLLLRKTTLSRKLSNEELNKRLSKVLFIIKLIKDKEMFMRYYKIHLARRLLLNATISIKLEERILKDLINLADVPTEYTYKLVRMFKDLVFSEEVQYQFRKSLASIYNMEPITNNNNNIIHTLTAQIEDTLNVQENNNKTPETGFDTINFRILNPSAWTKSKDKLSINLPEEIESMLSSFETFYESQYVGRKLDWCHRLSSGTITFNCDKGRFDLEITAAQLSILSIYNQQPKAVKTLLELEKLSCLSQTELKRNLWLLVANPKFKVQLMNSTPEVKDMKDLEKVDTEYSINHNFTLIKNGKLQSRGRISLIGRLQI